MPGESPSHISEIKQFLSTLVRYFFWSRLAPVFPVARFHDHHLPCAAVATHLVADDHCVSAEPVHRRPLTRGQGFAATDMSSARATGESDLLLDLPKVPARPEERPETQAAVPAAVVEHLCRQGITDPATWVAFGLDQVTPATLVRFGLTGKRCPRPETIHLPTWMPDSPDHIVGLIRVARGQNKHEFATKPVGIAGPRDVLTAVKVILVDHPLLAMRLHQAGAGGVILLEDPAVLPAVQEWLAQKTVVFATHRLSRLTPLRAVLGDQGAAAPSVLVSTASNRFSPEVRAALGLGPPEPEARPPLTPHLLTLLHQYARKRFEAGESQGTLNGLGLDIPELIAAYRIGYLPSTYRQALPKAAQQSLAGTRYADALFLPAYAEDGTLVDGLVLRTHSRPALVPSFWSASRGLLAPELIRERTDLTITDTVSCLARMFRQGFRDVLLMRGIDDARNNATRLRQAGVVRVRLQVRHDVDAYAALFQAAGLAVEVVQSAVTDVRSDHGGAVEPAPTPTPVPITAPPSPTVASAAVNAPASAQEVLFSLAGSVVPAAAAPPPAPAAAVPAAPAVPSTPAASSQLTLVEEDRSAETYVFEVGPFRYAVEARTDGRTRRRVVARCGGKPIQDDFDLAVPRACERFAHNAAATLGRPATLIQSHVLALLPLVRAQEEARDRIPTVPISADDRTAGIALLDAPDLLHRVASDLSALGWISEDRAKQVLYLVAISRLLPSPVWAVYQAGHGAAPWQGIGYVAALTPPEARLVFHRLSESVLLHTDRASLRHRLLILDAAETIRPEAAVALRVLHERGGIGWATATAATGGSPAQGLGEARGPVAVLAAAAGPLDPRCRDAFLTVLADASPAQTAASLAMQRSRLLADGTTAATAASLVSDVIARHHAAQRLLERLPVRIPFADRIIFPASRLRHRDEQAWFLGLVAAHALLHQRQRTRADGAVVATEADFAAVVACTAGLLGAESAGIAAPARHLLSLLFTHGVTAFTMADLAGLLPDWTRYAFRAALQDLCDFGHVERLDGDRERGQGRGRLQSFRLAVRSAAEPARANGIRLRPLASAPVIGEEVESVSVGELAKVGENRFANLIPRPTGT